VRPLPLKAARISGVVPKVHGSNFGAVRKQQLRYVCGIGDGRAMQGGQTLF